MLICSDEFFFGPKVTTSGLRELSRLSYISYRVIYTKVSGVCFQQTLSRGQKVIMMFAVSYQLCCVYYHVAQKLSGYVFQQFSFPRSKNYRDICIWVISSHVRVLSCCLHISYWEVFLTTFFHVISSCYLYEKLSVVCFQQQNSRQNYRGVCT